MRSFQRGWWYLKTFESILFLYSLIGCLCIKYLVRTSKWRIELSVWEDAFFPVPEKIVYSLLNLIFDLFWNSINMVYVSQLSKEELVCNYLFTSRNESHSVLDMDISAIHSLILSHLEISRIKLPKLTSVILTEIVTNPVVLVEQFHFYIHQPIKVWLFEKIIFELDYH